ncbi:Phosphatidylinositol 3-/4-kinase [Macleaya cordata]|uniref:1-phosphatidylinositol 4-kinase n=1 Tax=Macleaya cordata TaxID=56857 RepID=A0A200R0T4_MACCD|nr:Phosphatidylinositol 3-/4-kinase [Macleaya cordata]
MVRLLGLNRGESDSPREIVRPNLNSEIGESGWLIRFFDSAFFCEWIAVSYLYKHDHPGVRDYLCNRMYTLPLSGIESYLFQVCYMLVHKPSPSLDKFVIDMCSKSLQIALKVQWFLMAELEDSDDNEGISRIQEKCQIAATLMGEWPPLVRPQNAPSSPVSKNQVLNKLLSSKQRLLSLTSSPPTQRSLSFSPSSGSNSLQEDGSKSPDDNKIFKKFIPGPKVRDALLFRKSVEKDDDDSEKDGFFKRLLRDSKDEDDSEKDGFFKRLLRDSKDEDDSEKDGFFKRLLRDSKDEDEELMSSSEGFFKRLFRDSKNDSEEKTGPKSSEEDEKDGFFRKFFKEKVEDKKDGNDRSNDVDRGNSNIEDEEPSDFSLFRKLFRVHPEDTKSAVSNENGNLDGSFESSPGTENFFRKLFRDRDRSVQDSELFGSKKNKEKRPGSPRQRNEKSHAKPPLPNNITSQIRKGAYHVSLDFVQALCDTSYGLVDIFPIEDRKSALHESLTEINSQVATAQNSGGVCFPMGKGTYRVIHIPEDEAVLLNSREKAPYLICVEVLKGETPSHTKDTSNAQKLSRGGIPLANGDAQLPKPPPWAYPLWSPQDVNSNGTDRMLRSTSQAIDHAMAHLWEAKVKFVNVSLSIEKPLLNQSKDSESPDTECRIKRSNSASVSTGVPVDCEGAKDSVSVLGKQRNHDLEWVRVVLTADPGVKMEDIEDQEPPRRKEHRRVPSTIAIEEVKAAAAKGEAPLGLPLKGAGQDSSDTQPKASNGGVPKASDALSGELWEAKKERIRKASVFGKLPGWDLRSVIVKSGDDCRQEHLAVQLVSHFYDIFQEAGLPLWLRPYEVLVTSSYTALIETIPDTASIHSIKSRFPSITSLREFFVAKYEENSPSFKLAQRNFVESMAGYSILCYLLQVKDRHNGNLLMDEEGHIIHIDFGFMLSNSPGGVNFESAPFKLTRELLEVMDSDAEGVPSEFFDYFKVLCIQGFLTCRKHAERIILLVEMMQDSGYPCFKGGPRTIQNLRKRFHLSLTEEQCVSLVLSLISSSLDAWRTRHEAIFSNEGSISVSESCNTFAVAQLNLHGKFSAGVQVEEGDYHFLKMDSSSDGDDNTQVRKLPFALKIISILKIELLGTHCTVLESINACK